MSDVRGGPVGQAWLETAGTMGSAIDFMIRQVIAQKAYAGLVKVLAVSGGGVGSPPIVTVQPLVNQVDGEGNQTPHGPIYNIPVFRLQGGLTALILDPSVGDTGDAICCDRDISIVKVTGQVSGPGSFRQNDWSDGCYFGGFLNGTPTTYAQASDAGGITLVTPGASFGMTKEGVLTFTATNATLDADGNLSVTGEVTRGSGGADSVTLGQHKHGTGAAAAGTSVPTAGT